MKNKIIRVTYTRVYEFSKKELQKAFEVNDIVVETDDQLKSYGLYMANNCMSDDMETMNEDVNSFASAKVKIIE